ncbi:MAG: class II glutamine amidotransferase [Microbacteriaceae bacterium]|nr:class II glutamine amidotransferase [Microbacteriaceae bacterium]
MCRLLGYATRRPTTLAELIGEDELAEFTELSQLHGDGWGFGWATVDGAEIFKAPDSARHSREFGRHARGHRSDLGLAHLRWATLNLAVGAGNTHPFTDGTIAFAHNGSIREAERLDELIPDDLRAKRQGTTDSERYFLAVLAEARRSNLPAALATTVQRIAESHTFNGLNAIIATPAELIAVCRYTASADAAAEDTEYYDLRYRVADDGVIVSSSGWGAGWTSLRNGEILVVNRQTLDVVVRTLAEASADMATASATVATTLAVAIAS